MFDYPKKKIHNGWFISDQCDVRFVLLVLETEFFSFENLGICYCHTAKSKLITSHYYFQNVSPVNMIVKVNKHYAVKAYGRLAV
jgi:hypothetical protein